MWSHQTALCREDRSFAIALDAAAFQDEIEMRLIDATD